MSTPPPTPSLPTNAFHRLIGQIGNNQTTDDALGRIEAAIAQGLGAASPLVHALQVGVVTELGAIRTVLDELKPVDLEPIAAVLERIDVGIRDLARSMSEDEDEEASAAALLALAVGQHGRMSKLLVALWFKRAGFPGIREVREVTEDAFVLAMLTARQEPEFQGAVRIQAVTERGLRFMYAAAGDIVAELQDSLPPP